MTGIKGTQTRTLNFISIDLNFTGRLDGLLLEKKRGDVSSLIFQSMFEDPGEFVVVHVDHVSNYVEQFLQVSWDTLLPFQSDFQV